MAAITNKMPCYLAENRAMPLNFFIGLAASWLRHGAFIPLPLRTHPNDTEHRDYACVFN